MSSMTFSQKPFKAIPPEKGSFPLDHDGECKLPMLRYMRCLITNDNVNSKCRHQSMAYMGCRMDHNLMKRDSWENLGFGDIAPKEPITGDIAPKEPITGDIAPKENITATENTEIQIQNTESKMKVTPPKIDASEPTSPTPVAPS